MMCLREAMDEKKRRAIFGSSEGMGGNLRAGGDRLGGIVLIRIRYMRRVWPIGELERPKSQ